MQSFRVWPAARNTIHICDQCVDLIVLATESLGASGSDIARLLGDRPGEAHERETELAGLFGHRYVR
jgi:hypothetical protein